MGNRINKEIADIAPTLAALEKHNPFLVPDGYFSSLENRILDSIDKKPILGTSAPEGYFDNLSDRILERIKSEKEAKVIPFYRKRWISIAASFIILFGAGYLITTQSYISSDSTEFALEIDPEEALEYLEENDNLYLSDLLSLDILEDDIIIEDADLTDIDDAELDEWLDELDTEDLKELL